MPNTLKVDAPQGMPWIDWEREFDAPVPAVFAAHTNPQLYVQWIGPAIYTNTIERFDVRPGAVIASAQ